MSFPDDLDAFLGPMMAPIVGEEVMGFQIPNWDIPAEVGSGGSLPLVWDADAVLQVFEPAATSTPSEEPVAKMPREVCVKA